MNNKQYIAVGVVLAVALTGLLVWQHHDSTMDREAQRARVRESIRYTLHTPPPNHYQIMEPGDKLDGLVEALIWGDYR